MTSSRKGSLLKKVKKRQRIEQIGRLYPENSEIRVQPSCFLKFTGVSAELFAKSIVSNEAMDPRL